jgi:hypothetical protein
MGNPPSDQLKDPMLSLLGHHQIFQVFEGGAGVTFKMMELLVEGNRHE